MSHTSTIDSIVITDIAALRSALKQLQDQGVQCELVENTKPRAYYDNQQGLGEAPYVVRLPQADYDIGLYPRSGGGYEARTDLYGGTVKKVLGAPAKDDEDVTQASMGKLFQAYAVQATISKAVQQGYRVQTTTKPDGTVQLRVAA